MVLGAYWICMAGCSTKPAAQPSQPAADHAHVHGPHDGELIELGDEEYHAELVHDPQANTVTVYLLDKDAAGAATTTEPEITITITLAGAATPFKLAAKPLESEPAGQSSRFVSTDPNLGLALDNEAAKRELTAKIGPKSHTAQFEHFEEHHHHDHPPEK
jgi:hypothetical protein